MGKEKKEIWKLIELLNEYDTEIMKSETRPRATYKWKLSCCWYDMHEVSSDLLGYLIISKQFRFIKWLVENDKIDIVKVYKNLNDYEIEIRIRAVKELLEDNEEDTIAYLKLLMLLAIQDEPIRFLCEIIK